MKWPKNKNIYNVMIFCYYENRSRKVTDLAMYIKMENSNLLKTLPTGMKARLNTSRDS